MHAESMAVMHPAIACLAGLLLCAGQAAGQAAGGALHLPRLGHRWKQPGDAAKAPITLDELERCMGDRTGARALRERIEAEGGALETEADGMTRDARALQEARARVESTGAALENDLRAHEEQGG